MSGSEGLTLAKNFRVRTVSDSHTGLPISLRGGHFAHEVVFAQDVAMQERLRAILARSKPEPVEAVVSADDVLAGFADLHLEGRPRSESDSGSKKRLPLPRISSTSSVGGDASQWLDQLISFV